MIVLYGHPGAASSAPMAVFEGLGVAYRYEVPDRASDAYRAVHPLGFVPAVTWDDGETTVESAAIVLTALERFDDAGRLAPAPKTSSRARFHEALAFLAAQVYPTFQRIYQTHRVGPEDIRETIRVHARAQQETHWAFLDGRLADRGWLAGDAFSAVDIYLLMLVTWCEDILALCARHPNIARVCRGALDRDYVERAFRAHEQAGEVAAIRG